MSRRTVCCVVGVQASKGNKQTACYTTAWPTCALWYESSSSLRAPRSRVSSARTVNVCRLRASCDGAAMNGVRTEVRASCCVDPICILFCMQVRAILSVLQVGDRSASVVRLGRLIAVELCEVLFMMLKRL